VTASSSLSPLRRLAACAAPAVALVLTACSDPEPLSFGNGHAPGDAAYAGQQLFLTHAWGTEVLGSWPPADFMLSLMDEEAFADQYSKFGFIPDPADDFPVGFKRGSVDPDPGPRDVRALPRGGVARRHRCGSARPTRGSTSRASGSRWTRGGWPRVNPIAR
jgi:hypothetical protein